MTYPSVTQVLGVFSNFDRVPPGLLNAAQERGTLVHGACVALAKGIWHPPVAEEYAGYVESFSQWLTLVDKVILAETRLTDEILGYTGKPDLVIKMKDGELFLCDIKTGVTKQKTWPAQIAAYRRLVKKGIGIDVGLSGDLMLNKDGKTPRMVYCKDTPDDFNAFLAALTAYRYFK